jgi:thiamine-phosphate pyrophosphorylase
MGEGPYTGVMLRFAITPGLLRAGGALLQTEALVQRAAELAQDGVDLLLLREKLLGPEEIALLARKTIEASRGSGMRIVVAVAADGVPGAEHVPGAGVHLSAARFDALKAKSPGTWVSASCHRPEQVRRAAAMGLDAVLFAPVFGKLVDGVEVVQGAGVEALREASEAAGRMPVFALGGVNQQNAQSCLEAGAAGVAGIRMFFEHFIAQK